MKKDCDVNVPYPAGHIVSPNGTVDWHGGGIRRQLRLASNAEISLLTCPPPPPHEAKIGLFNRSSAALTQTTDEACSLFWEV